MLGNILSVKNYSSVSISTELSIVTLKKINI